MSGWKSLMTSAPLISLFLKQLSYRSSDKNLIALYNGILEPCLTAKSHYARDSAGKIRTVQVPFHECPKMNITDYFSALGYLLTCTHHQPTFTELVQLLGQYAEWCRISASILSVNPPTVVQVLFDIPSHDDDVVPRFSLASSVSAGKGEGREDVRKERTKTLSAFWGHSLVRPSPVQRAHAMAGIGFKGIEASAELFGTPWGHCGESVTFPSLYKSMHTARPLGTLALSVKAMTTAIPGTSTVPVYAIQSLTQLGDIVELLRVSGSMRPMCLNCLYLRDGAGARVEDFASS